MPSKYAIPENYKVLKELGQGCYGNVIKCFKRDTAETVAVKVLKRRHSKHHKVTEVLILEKLRCLDPDKYNIVRCHEWFHRNDQTFVVFEVLDMSLYDYMCQTKRTTLPLNGIRTIIKDVATALNALKDVGLIHTDLKMDNVMLVDHQKQPFRVKIIDFGLSLQKSEARQGKEVQPLWHRSPEIILGLPFNEAIDVWSLGSMVAEMLLGSALFPGRNEYDVLRFIIDLLGEPPKRLLNSGMYTWSFYNGCRKYLMFRQWTLKTPAEYHAETGIKPRETRRHKLSSLDDLKTLKQHQQNIAEADDRAACVDLLKDMLQLDPKHRITPSQILAHPFITGTCRSSSSSKRVTETSQAISKTQGSADTKADGFSKKLPRVIFVRPAKKTMQTDTATKQCGAVGPQAVQNKAKDDKVLAQEPLSGTSGDTENDFVLGSFADGVTESPDVVSEIMVTAPVPSKPSCGKAPKQAVLHPCEVSKPKKNKMKKAMQGCSPNKKDTFFCCFHVPEDGDKSSL